MRRTNLIIWTRIYTYFSYETYRVGWGGGYTWIVTRELIVARYKPLIVLVFFVSQFLLLDVSYHVFMNTYHLKSGLNVMEGASYQT